MVVVPSVHRPVVDTRYSLYPRAEVGHICPIMALQPLLMSVILCREETAYTS